MSNDGELSRPPEPPPLERKLRLSWPQGLMIVVILVTVAVALAGGLDPEMERVAATSRTLEVQVEYPARLRHSKRGVFRVWVRSEERRVGEAGRAGWGAEG